MDFEDKCLKKIVFSYSNALESKIFSSEKIVNFDDISIMSYLVDTSTAGMSLTEMLKHYLLDESGISQNNDEAVRQMPKLYEALKDRLHDAKMHFVYETIEKPFVALLRKMERIGIKVSVEALKDIERDFDIEIASLQDKIWKECGTEFNIASPKQLANVLFEHLKIAVPKGIKKSKKTDSYSTSAEVLELLEEDGCVIASLLLKHRHYSKLKNTYTSAIIEKVSSITGRVHTTFYNTSTLTGRISSQNPNLQNIPTKSNEGARIRSAFIAQDGWLLASADYSQMELRLLAYMADVPELKAAFEAGCDIHAQTAADIFGIKLESVGSTQRQRAKAVNFGIIYGISAFGLAKNLGCTKIEAQEIIDKYFAKYPRIKQHMENCVQNAQRTGFVETIFGRKIKIPNINSKIFVQQQFAKREAINAPLQGSAADITKKAMLLVENFLTSNNLQTRILLQIHDEILLEVKQEEQSLISNNIAIIMQNVKSHLTAPSLQLGTLQANLTFGQNWMEL